MSRHQNPLADDLLATGILRTKSKKRKAERKEDDGDGYIDSKSSRKILKLGEELAAEDREGSKITPPSTAFTFESRAGAGVGESSEAEDDAANYNEEEEAWRDENEEEETVEDNIAAHEQAGQGEGREPEILGGGRPEDAVEIPVKVVEVYTKVGMILSRYKSGKLPKPFKILPTLPHWEELLSITRPEAWTPNACYEATRIFVSSNPKVVRRFLETVILEVVREDIHETKKLNVHLYKALQKATYKPAAFFKGILFPLVESGTCTLREAHIISSVITRCSIPPLHSSAALMRLTDIAAEQASVSTEGGGATNIFIRAFLEKKYALPYKVVDNLVFHFLRFRADLSNNNNSSINNKNDESMTLDTPQSSEQTAKLAKLPVLWHQSLLAFAQRYRDDITEDQREALLDLILVRGHKEIGPEVRRELLAGRGRGVPLLPVVDGDGGDGDDTMVMS